MHLAARKRELFAAIESHPQREIVIDSDDERLENLVSPVDLNALAVEDRARTVGAKVRERPDVFVAGHEAIDRIGDDAATQVIRIGTIAGKGADDAVFKAIRRLDDVHSDTHHDVGDGLGLGIEACLAQDAAYLASIN